MRYVIIGGGIAGTTAAEELRKLDSDASITVVEAEEHRLYSRVLLPHYVEGRVERDRVFLKKPEWYAEKNIDLQLGIEVRKIDVNNQFVLTSEGRELPFDKLLVTTGGSLRLLQEDLRGVAYLRSLDDADYLLHLIREVKLLPESDRHAAVFGGGFIALEFLNIFAKHEIPVTLLMRSTGFWSRILSLHSQSVIRTHIESTGVRIISEVADFSLIGEKELEAINISGERIPARILGVGIGIDADRQLLVEADIACRSGVVANEFLESSVRNVYTAGDVAEFFDVISGRHVVQGNWMNAIMQGRAVAHVMHGERKAFELVSSYATDFLGMDAVFIGDVDREHADAVVQHVAEPTVSVELFERGGYTVGAVLIGDVMKRQEITNAIKQRKRYVG